MVKSGSFKVKQAPLAGRIGSGIGQGLAEQLPKGIQEGRLQEGLQRFAREAPGQSPLEAASNLMGIPGITPQMIQILPQLLQQQQLAQSLNQPQTAPAFPSIQQEEPGQPTAGLTTRPGIEATRKGYIPPSAQEIDARAAQLYNANPGRFKNNPENAIQYAQSEAAQEQAINQAFQQQRAGEQTIQRSVQSNLQTQAGLLGAAVPGQVYSDIEQKAIRSVLPKQEGGEGLTEEEAKIKYGGELDQVSREYNALKAIGNWTLPTQKPQEILRNLDSVREQFKKRGDLRNFADTLIGTNGLSPSKAYYVAYKDEVPDLNKTLSKLPDVNPVTSVKKGFLETKQSDYNPDAIMNLIMPKLAEQLGKNGSPLAVAEMLQSKGYDPSIWLNYLNQNRRKLELTNRQEDELNKPTSFIPNLNDIWLFKLTNQDKLVE